MSSHAVTLALYVLIVQAGIALELLGRGGRTRIPPLGVVLSRIMRTRSGVCTSTACGEVNVAMSMDLP
jgi:hypothetical protein